MTMRQIFFLIRIFIQIKKMNKSVNRYFNCLVSLRMKGGAIKLNIKARLVLVNDYVNEKNVAVVYPQGISDIGVYSWNVGVAWDFNTSDDIEFISKLIDQVSEDFVIDTNRIYACGYSNGGFMTYELACELSDRITAFGSVAGNFMLNFDQQCSDLREIPITKQTIYPKNQNKNRLILKKFSPGSIVPPKNK